VLKPGNLDFVASLAVLLLPADVVAEDTDSLDGGDDDAFTPVADLLRDAYQDADVHKLMQDT
jgi:hypothetical protein